MTTFSVHAGVVSVQADGIACFRPQPYTDLDAEDIAALLDVLFEHEISRLLVEHHVPHSLSFAAQQLLGRARTLTALALLVRGPINHMVAQTFVRYHAPAYAVLITSDDDEALRWLTEQPSSTDANADG